MSVDDTAEATGTVAVPLPVARLAVAVLRVLFRSRSVGDSLIT